MKRPVPLLLALALSACATLDKDDCQHADWRTFGVEDGANGRTISNIRNYREACAEYGVTPNFDEYQAGHVIGARTFCTPTNGFARGRAGADGYESFCPKDVAGPFLAEYQRGRAVHAAEQRLERERKALADVVNELDQVDENIIAYTGLLAADKTPTEERVKLARELVELGTRRSSLTFERPKRERAVAAAEAEVARALRESGR